LILLALAIPDCGLFARFEHAGSPRQIVCLLKECGSPNAGDTHLRVLECGSLHVFRTKKEFDNYYLRAEFKWGEGTHGSREEKARDREILLHVVGPNNVWPRSIEFQMIEGGTGDILMVGRTEVTVKGAHKNQDRFDRFGKGSWKDVAGYRDPINELEKPHVRLTSYRNHARGMECTSVGRRRQLNQLFGERLSCQRRDRVKQDSRQIFVSIRGGRGLLSQSRASTAEEIEGTSLMATMRPSTVSLMPEGLGRESLAARVARSAGISAGTDVEWTHHGTESVNW
jgi:hypothetical protein